jgi:hypothetical protein
MAKFLLSPRPGGALTARSRLMRHLPLLFAGLLAFGCATTPAQKSISWSRDPNARIKDSVPERSAAQRAANRDLDPEGAEDKRWGTEAARERKRRQQDEESRRQHDAQPSLPTQQR